jgi:hypothetical protein
MLDFAPDTDGLIAPDQVKRYQEFGDWIRACYNHPIAATGPSSGNVTLTVPATVRCFVMFLCTSGSILVEFVTAVLVGYMVQIPIESIC